MEASKLIGFFVGIGVAVLLIWAMFKRFNTDGSTKTEYDERQKTIRGIGYTYGYYTLMAYVEAGLYVVPSAYAVRLIPGTIPVNVLNTITSAST